MHQLEELVRLHRKNTGYREVAKLLGVSPNTERQYRNALIAEGLLYGDPKALPPLKKLVAAARKHLGDGVQPEQSISSVDAWRDQIQEMLGRGAGPGAIYDALRLQEDFKGSLSAVKRLCVRLKRERGVQAEDVAIPVDTEPGKYAQVDFGYVGRLYEPQGGIERRAWVFVMVLAHSRDMYAEIVFDQKTTTWLELHLRAFRAFGGVPEIIRPDNLKAAVTRAAFSTNDDLALNRSFRELAKHYDFKIDPTPPRSPKKKGKVESAVKYIKNNFFKPRSFIDIADARQQLTLWLEKVAGQRIHGTTGRRPREVFEAEEKAALLPLPQRPFEIVEWKKAKVHPDSHIYLDRRLYSAPWRLIGQELWVKASPHTVAIFAGVERVATHARRGQSKRSTIEAHLPEHRRDYRHRQRAYWEDRAALLGDEVVTYIEAVFDADDVIYQLRTVQQIIKHLETFPKSRARNACKRAHYFGNFKYGAIKDILRKGLDLEPLPQTEAEPPAPKTASLFARKPSEIINPNLELFPAPQRRPFCDPLSQLEVIHS
jgi:transposase